ncbi:MAG: hypothetical protein A2541_02175 [Candidatus Taylorbacteria bacterium RIFOXYD2_FULL_36_9]|uniref:Transmembrane protein n=1 Tax=Candidatus Taylorbacteria bacterium RIFOXYD2_FULL_36_9 TaxID=1802338 RepID=A0A1G2PGU9_9BACT|nr:MAG: hypothetical protein A2541_02175 [Candidatus Taylorbacteria bacterium RIFOXYD2_FULL_36_9]
MLESSKEKKKNFWFFTVLGILILASVVTTFVRYYVLKDYQIIAQVSCDPNIELCFQVECDNTVDDSCLVNSDNESVTYYKIISKRASNIALCEKSVDKIGCADELSCIFNEEQCSYEYCTEEALGEGELCVGVNK